MKINILKYCTLLLAVIALGFSFTGCSKDDDNSVQLDAFGPSPALRGGELRFLGSNLDRVTAVVLPDGITISNITRVSNGEIIVSIPQEAVPGYVILKTEDGDITTKTKLTFSEPITIDKFYKTGTDGEIEISVIAGDEITIEGDYLNLIREVVFTDNVVVSLEREDGETYPRETLTVKVPLGAQTGKIALSNGAEIPILVYTENELTVATATVTSISPTTIKAGTELTIKGKNLQLIEKVKIEPSLEIAVTPAQDPLADKTEITITIPDNAQDGDVTLVGYSGLETKAGTITMMLPAVTSVSPNPVKGGNVLTIKGTNLDLVTNINFPNVEDAVEVASKAATQITINVPLEAADGNLALNTNSGKTVEVAYTTVKSTITNITPTSLMAGNDITVTGTNLDLVRSVTFGGGVSASITPSSPTTFTITVPTTATSGAITLNLVNGATVTSSISLNVTPSTNPVITTMPSSARPEKEITLKGTNLNTVDAFYFETAKVTAYSERTATSVTLTVPAGAPMGSYKIKMVTYSNETFYSNDPIAITGVDPVDDPALVIFDFEDRNGNSSANNAGDWGGIANGKSTATDGVSGSFYEITASNWNSGAYWWVADNWIEAPYPSVSGIGNYVVKMDVRLRNDITADGSEIRLRIAGNKEANFLPYLLKNGVWTTGGEWITISIPLSAFSGLEDPTPTGGDWGIVSGWNPDAKSFVGFCVDNIRYHKN